MTDIRRTLLWVVFTMSLFLLWDAWLKHTGQPSMFGPQATPPTATAPSASAALPQPSSASPAPAPTQAAAAAPTAEAAPAAAGELVTVTTDVAKVTFDSRGASVVRFELLAYPDQNDSSRNVLIFDRSAERTYRAETGLVGVAGAPTHLTNFSVQPGERELKPGQNSLTVRFETQAGGLKVAKTYTLARGSYVVDVKHEIQNVSSAPLAPQLYLQLVRDGNPPPGESSFYFTFTGPAAYTDETKFRKIDFKSIEKGQPFDVKSSSNGWVAMVQHYFASAWLPPAGSQREFYTKKVDNNLYSVGMLFPLPAIEPGAARTIDDRLFVGPQEENKLSTLAPGLELVKDYGWFTILSKPLFWLLDHLHKLIGNWGWAIVALVFLLKAAFYLPQASAYKSMAKMKAINPRIMELRERYKDKPQQMQQEMMRIYREEKVNPVGGCLPILLQMPFFIALYWVLLSSVEMRGAEWLYIGDLAQPDRLLGTIPFIHMPLGLLPLLMTASTMFQTWLNPTPPDPVQARMMWIMPLVFSIMFFFFPAGLVLYWLTNNLLSIAQQWYINRKLGVSK